MNEDIGYIFIYVGTFGISDMFIEYYKLEGIPKLLYYSFFVGIGLVMILYFKKYSKQRDEQPLLQ